ncbi:serine protease inhibitor 2-like isoform X1 [Uranotaenia lowii]|uniref:serine protease inhibitor 2-like isoform X1 n=1 Tax=Uranotaenia lowii TaxID=190385 RepID=UPI00247AD762|nr:serine protease inhibitor 2-like isoform X1 [Uranotaenia lowii]
MKSLANRNRLFATTLVLLISTAHFGSAASLPPEDESPFSYDPPRNDAFDWKLIKSIFPSVDSNVVMSTFSTKYLLNILYEGTSDGSQTQRELNEPLERSGRHSAKEEATCVRIMKALQQKPNQLSIASAVFVDQEINVQQKFAGTVTMSYNASLMDVNFGDSPKAAEQINKWIREGTRGQVENLVSPDSLRDTFLLLANTVYFKGLWANVFPTSATTTQSFKTGDGRTVQVPFMKQINYYHYTESNALNAKLLRLPYENYKFSMVILLPNQNSNLQQLISKLSSHSIRDAINAMEQDEVKVELPRFRIDYSGSQKEALLQLGVNRIFQDSAELGAIVRGRNQPLKVGDIFQKSVIVVDEQGSTASAASGASLVFTIASEPEQFYVNRPFLFFLEETSTNTILFVGKVENPSV